MGVNSECSTRATLARIEREASSLSLSAAALAFLAFAIFLAEVVSPSLGPPRGAYPMGRPLARAVDLCGRAGLEVHLAQQGTP
jgi:hypothetical protein